MIKKQKRSKFLKTVQRRKKKREQHSTCQAIKKLSISRSTTMNNKVSRRNLLRAAGGAGAVLASSAAWSPTAASSLPEAPSMDNANTQNRYIPQAVSIISQLLP